MQRRRDRVGWTGGDRQPTLPKPPSACLRQRGWRRLRRHPRARCLSPSSLPTTSGRSRSQHVPGPRRTPVGDCRWPSARRRRSHPRLTPFQRAPNPGLRCHRATPRPRCHRSGTCGDTCSRAWRAPLRRCQLIANEGMDKPNCSWQPSPLASFGLPRGYSPRATPESMCRSRAGHDPCSPASKRICVESPLMCH